MGAGGREDTPAMTLEAGGRVLETDPEGYLRDLSDWNEAVAEQMARQDGIELDENHWEVIRFLQGYYDEYGIAPAIRPWRRSCWNTRRRCCPGACTTPTER